MEPMVQPDSDAEEGQEPPSDDRTRVEASTMPDRNDTAAAPAGVGGRGRRVWLALALPLLFVLVAFGIDRAVHVGEVLRGVELEGVSMVGLDDAAAHARVAALEQELRGAPLAIVVRGRRFELDPTQVAFALDADALVAQALASGREGSWIAQLGWWLTHLQGKSPLTVHGRLDAERLNPILESWERDAIDDPPFEGAVIGEAGSARAQPPREGWVIDDDAAALAVVEALARRERAGVDLPLVKRVPVRTAAAVDAALGRARALLAGPITLVAELPEPIDVSEDSRARPGRKRRGAKADAEEGPRTQELVFGPEALADALASRLIEEGQPGLEVYFDGEALAPALAEAKKVLEQAPADARFLVSRRDEVSVVPSREGRVVDAQQVAAALLEAAATAERRGVFPVKSGEAPAFTTEQARQLAIVGLVSDFTTTFPCCRPRVKNIQRIADMIDGVVLSPGQTFSINEHVGERTAKKGFVPAPTIVHGKMKDTLGGGVSQFATTFFNAAFYGGYDIVERQPHSFYFERYPMGHEATLSFPKPDVIIRNDTEAGLLIRTFYTGASITVKFYGDNGGRKVKRHRSALMDIVDPPIEYIADPDLEPDEEKVKARGKPGWSVLVSRTITYPDGHDKKEGRKVTYNPRIRKLRVHPCRIPEGEDGYTGERCPEPEEGEEEGEEHGPGGEAAGMPDTDPDADEGS